MSKSLFITIHALQEQKAQDYCADHEVKQWTHEEKIHSARDLKAQWYEQEQAILHDEVQKLQLQVELQHLKVQKATMQKGHSGEGPES